MFDNSQVFKSHLFSWKLFILKMFPSTLLIISSYFLILTVKFSSNSKLDFRVVLAEAIIKDEGLIISVKSAQDLGLIEGDSIRYLKV